MFYVSWGRKLKGLGNVRIGHSLRGKSAWYFLIVFGFLQLLWYFMLGSLWLMYGVGYVFFYLPIKGIIKLCKKKQIADAAKKYERPNT